MKESKIFTKQNLTEKVHYVYRVIIDGKYYIGKRTGCLNDLITGRYKTSSNLVHEKLQNGHHFSKIKIIGVFSTSKDALEFESRILTRVDAKRNSKFLNQSNGSGDFTFKQHTEKTKEKISKTTKERFDKNTEQGRKQREIRSETQRKFWDENTEYGRKRREKQSQSAKAKFDINTEEGRRNLEKQSQISSARFDPNTEEGRKRREDASKKSKAQFDKNTEEGRKQREIRSEIMKKSTKIRVQNRKNASILSELMFDEEFIRENFLITDDKNNLRFLWSVYSKLTGYSRSRIKVLKREGKLIFLHRIRSISISKELENSKIKEIEAIIKSRNEELSLKAS